MRDPGAREIKEYWSKCWGNDMNGITPERGIWVTKGGQAKKLHSNTEGQRAGTGPIGPQSSADQPRKTMTTTPEHIGEVLASIERRADAELFALTQEQLAAKWYWRWEQERSVEWNIYQFSDMLEMHKRQARRWEEHHGGSCCVVERVRDKYLMPRVREFLAALAQQNTNSGTGTVG
jgi:hypothetical protein